MPTWKYVYISRYHDQLRLLQGHHKRAPDEYQIRYISDNLTY